MDRRRIKVMYDLMSFYHKVILLGWNDYQNLTALETWVKIEVLYSF